MAEVKAVTIGAPGWVDLGSADASASRAFYSELFGWTAEVTDDPQAGGYAMFKSGGKEVGGVGPLQMPGQPTAWTVYVLVDDAAATARKAKDAGGTVIAEPFEVMSAGTMSIIASPSGAAIGLWQPGEHVGFEVKGVPGTYSWAELNTRDLPADQAFYTSVFGWDVTTENMGTLEYTLFKLDGESVAGGMDITPFVPEHVPSHWGVYFEVADPDATAAKVTQLGGTVLQEPADIPDVGRFAGFMDPQGAHFSVIKGAPAS